ncbi:unnamed protein product [Protopolystoma xenopodis]|uniref:Uncharacterized protein n=1 Tax=Protopolystoma xenopodis TaxID=117903 RepID=A0A448XL78_9PLAT|nr:unnamed protein product [Protopolystoma xenopodis]
MDGGAEQKNLQNVTDPRHVVISVQQTDRPTDRSPTNRQPSALPSDTETIDANSGCLLPAVGAKRVQGLFGCETVLPHLDWYTFDTETLTKCLFYTLTRHNLSLG